MGTRARAVMAHRGRASGAGGRRPADPVHRPEHPVLALQRLAGNQATASLLALQRGCRCSDAGSSGSKAIEVADVQRAASEAAGVTTTPAATASGPMLRKGSSGPAVKAAQVDLNTLGATPQLDPDGQFGSKTDTAVRFFQSAHRLVPDGIIGPATSTMLRNERAIEDVNFLVPCHTPEKPGPSGHEEKPLDESEGPGPTRFNLVGQQLAPGQGKGKVNLTLVMTGSAQDKEEAAAVGGTVVNISTLAELKATLDKHPDIGTVAIISHGSPVGQVFVGTTATSLSTIAAALTQRTNGTVDRVQFLGCNIGNDPSGMKAIKTQLGAGAVEGTNCNLESQRLTPARRGGGQGREILKESDLPPGMAKASFGQALKTLIPNHVDTQGNTLKAPDCGLGFGPGTKLATIDPVKLADLYFARNGRLFFRFVPGGACWEDLRFDKALQGCKRVQV